MVTNLPEAVTGVLAQNGVAVTLVEQPHPRAFDCTLVYAGVVHERILIHRHDDGHYEVAGGFDVHSNFPDEVWDKVNEELAS